VSTNSNRPRPDYGVDAPGVVRNLAVFGATGVIGGLSLAVFVQARSLWLGSIIGTGICGGGCLLLTAAWMVFGSKVLKVRLRDRLLNEIPWQGDEQVLDVGCGRGLMLIGAARRLTTGLATGLDLWQTVDQSGNSPETTRANALAEGVAERIKIKTGDARELPFSSGSFDVVLSSWALHNLYDPGDRAKALGEMVRVLKPGGRVVLVDIRHAHEFAERLKEAGLVDVRVSGPSFIFLTPSRVVAGKKS
jgi:SAM-dependent methyltransferase